MKERDYSLDLVKLITIFLVLFGHILPILNIEYAYGHEVRKFIYSFHMPLFMIISGYFSARSISTPFLEMLIKKSKQLVIPALTCTFIICLWAAIDGNISDFSYRDEIIGNSWFLKTLFVYYILAWLMKHQPLNEYLFAIICILTMFCLPHAYSLQMNLLLPYFFFGYFTSKNQSCLADKKIGGGKLALCLLSLAIFLTFYCFFYRSEYIPITAKSIISNARSFAINYIVGLSGSLFVIELVSVAFKVWGKKKILQKIAAYGKYTLGVYCLQTILIDFFLDKYTNIVIEDLALYYAVVLIVSLSALILCIVVIKLLSKNKYLNLILFGGAYGRR